MIQMEYDRTNNYSLEEAWICNPADVTTTFLDIFNIYKCK